jgi:hypothetical protein
MAVETTPSGQGDSGQNQPTGNEGQQPSNTGTQQPAGAIAQPGGKQDERPFFDPKQHVPRSRLDEVSTKLKTTEAALRAELEAERRKVLALSGVQPKSEQDVELEATRKVLEKMYPGLAKLSDAEFVKKLEGSISAAESLQANTEQYWTNQGARSFRELEDFAKKELGGDLTPRGKRALRAAFIDYVQSDEDASRAYVEQDPEVVSRFWEEYKKTFIDPVRRTNNANLMERQNRLRVPRGGGSAPHVPAPKKPDFKNEDDVHNSAWEAIKQRLTS